MRSLFPLIALLINSPLFSQDTLSPEVVSNFSYSFNLAHLSLQGEGAKILEKEFQESQFVLLGETHDDAEIAKFTKTIIPLLKANGFHYFFTENGNTSLQLMLDTLKNSAAISQAHQNFYQNEIQKTGFIPLPFFKGKEDLAFLEASLKNKMELRGIDQEYIYSYALLFEALLALSDRSPEIIAAHHKARDVLLRAYHSLQSSKDFDFFKKLAQSQEIKSFLELLDTENSEIAEIVNSLSDSWLIYSLNESNIQASYTQRGALMQKQFQRFYAEAVEKDSPAPKILIKMGALHTMRGKNPLGILDIGEHVSTLANKNQSKDLNLLFMFRYYLDSEESLGYFDNADNNSQWVKERQAFSLQGKVEEWTLIDLKAVKNYVREKNLFVYPPLIQILSQNDYVIIPPATRDIVPNY